MTKAAVSVKGISHVSLYVSDIDRSVRFYEEVFGFETVFEEVIDSSDLDEISGSSAVRGRLVGGRIGDLRIELLTLLKRRPQRRRQDRDGNDFRFRLYQLAKDIVRVAPVTRHATSPSRCIARSMWRKRPRL